MRGGALYFSVTLPNLIMGTVGNGKELVFVKENLKKMGLSGGEEVGKQAQQLAGLCAASVLWGTFIISCSNESWRINGVSFKN